MLGHTCDTSVNGLEAVVAVTGQKPAVDGAPAPRADGEEPAATQHYDLILMVSFGGSPQKTGKRDDDTLCLWVWKLRVGPYFHENRIDTGKTKVKGLSMPRRHLTSFTRP